MSSPFATLQPMNSKTTITCPHCKSPISLDDALTSQISSSVEESLRIEYQQKVLTVQKETEEKIRKNVLEESKRQLGDLEEQLKEEKKRRAASEEQELALRKKERELIERSEKMELEVERKMEEERKKIQEAIEVKLLEASRQKVMEKDKIITDLQKALEDANRKASQGSQQTQGEVRELALEEHLRTLFRDDVIEPIGKGVNGADVRQIVRSSRGTVCGTILWESKQTKTWSEGWLLKLKTDLRAEKADIPILITAAYNDPKWSGQDFRDGVWICSTELYAPLAMALRKSLIDAARERAMAQGRGEKADLVYSYVSSPAFRQQVESFIDVYTEMQQQITKEKVAMERIWKAREGQSQRLMLSMGTIYGTVQGLAGSAVIPEIAGMDLLESGSES